jgi:hypothetical protein
MVIQEDALINEIFQDDDGTLTADEGNDKDDLRESGDGDPLDVDDETPNVNSSLSKDSIPKDVLQMIL